MRKNIFDHEKCVSLMCYIRCRSQARLYDVWLWCMWSWLLHTSTYNALWIILIYKNLILFCLFNRNDIDYRSDSWSTCNIITWISRATRWYRKCFILKKKITGGNSISLEYLKIFFRKVIFKKIKKKKFVLSIANLREM